MQETLIESFRLSPQQRHLCALQQAEEPFPFYTHCLARLEGRLDVSRLRSALAQLVERYEILRTSFPYLPGFKLPTQVIGAGMPLPFVIYDYSTLLLREQEKALLQLREAVIGQFFPLSDGPLWQMTLVICDAEHYWLLWDLSALCADAHSCHVLLRALGQLYEKGIIEDEALADPLQYADLAEWQYELLESAETANGIAYWRSLERALLRDISLPYELPADRPLSFTRCSLSINIAPVELAQLQALAQQLDVAPAAVSLACWGAVLTRLNGQSSLSIGTGYNGRKYEELAEAAGPLVKFLPLPYQFMEDARVCDVVHQVESTMREAYKWQEFFDWPLLKTFKEQEQEEPFPSVGFDYDVLPSPWQTGSLQWIVEEQEGCLERFKISLSCLETAHGMQVTLHYDGKRFGQEDMQRLLTQWRTVLLQVLASSNVTLGSLQLLTLDEQRRLLLEWNDTRADYPRDKCLYQLFEEQVERTPDRIAVVFEDEQVSYQELDQRANQLARYLQRRGVGPEVHVGLCLERSVSLLVGLLGILKADGAYVPLDPSYPQERLAFVLQDAEIPLLLTQERLLERLPGMDREVVCLDGVAKKVIADESRSAPEHRGHAEQLAYVLYTSGSTGQPKGVMVPHRGLVNYLHWAAQTYVAPESNGIGAPLHSPIGFDLTVTSLFVPLLTGQSLLLLPEEPGISALAAALSDKNGFTLAKVTPSHLEALRQVVPAEQLADATLVLIIGGEALRHESLAFWQRSAPRTRLINEYGPTETVVGCSIYEVPRESTFTGAVPIGKPIANMQLYVLDKHGQPVPVGVTGELYVGGEGVTRGYLNRPELTAERFVPHPFSSEPGARLYKTGDLARYQSDGDLEYVGRGDQQVKIRSYRIELGEIETQLRQHPSVEECVVMAREDVAGEKRLVAYVVLQRGQTLASSDLRTYLQNCLPSYMVPAAFVPLNALPLTSNGKVDRQKLPAPGNTGSEMDGPFVAPRTEVEATLATIWSQVLRIERIGIHDNFFALGGDSILSIQVVARAKQVGLHLIPRQMFQYQSIAQLSSVVTHAVTSRAEQDLVTGPVSLTPIQQWFFARNLSEPHHYNQAMLLETRQPLHASWLHRALLRLVLHHDALRLRFVYQADGWQQDIAGPPSSDTFFFCVDLSALPEGQQEAVMTALAEEAQTSIDLEAGILLRSLFFVRGAALADRLLLIIHHLAVDGVSWRILLEDLETLCQQLYQEEPMHLPDKTTSWQQWAQVLLEYAQSEELLSEHRYWLAPQRQLVTSLPVDMSKAENTIATSETVSVSLPAEQTLALLQEVPAVYHTQINDVLLTALAQAFATWTGQYRLLIDLEGHGREELVDDVDLSRTVGWFTVQFPVLLDIERTTDAGEALKAVKEQLRQIPRKGVGYGLLRYMNVDSAVSERLANLPQAEIVFNYFGQLDGQFTASPAAQSLLHSARGSVGSVHSKLEQRPYLLEINARIAGGELRLVWRYGQYVYQRQTIQRLAQSFIEALENLITHCRSLEISEYEYTPSDFPLVALNQQQLDGLMRQIVQARPEQSNQQIEDIYPLSPMQAGLLFHCLYAPDSAVYCGHYSWTIEGPLNIDAWRWAWQQVVDRHPMLRTCFVWQGLSAPLQVVRRQSEIPLTVHDWRFMSEQEQQQNLDALRLKEEHEGFDLQTAPLLRISLVRVAEQTFYFHLSLHHLLLDGWSQPQLFGEVQAYYYSFNHDEKPLLAPVRPYRDYIAWLLRQDTGQAEQFWRRYLVGFTSPTKLAVDRRPYAGREQSDRIMDVEQRQFSEEMTAALQQLGKRYQLTLNTIIQGAWALLLSRYSGEEEVVFGATVAGRPAELMGVEAMIGLFINTLPVRVRIERETSLLSWLTQLQERQSEVRQYEYTPLIDIQSWSEVPAEQPLFESLLLFQNYPLDPMRKENTSALSIRRQRSIEYTNYALTLKVAVSGGTLALQLAYDSSRFTAVTVSRFVEHLHMLLGAIVAYPQQRLIDLPLLTDTERHTVLAAWNATQASGPSDIGIHELFEQQVAQTPDAIALVFQDSYVTYSFLDAAARRVALHLQDLGIEAGAPVGVCMERSLEQVVGLLGILKAGGAYVPLDPTYPRERLFFMLEDSHAAALVIQSHLVEIFPMHTTPVLYLPDALFDSNVASAFTRKCSPEQVAYIIYTSGSTGRPKGTMIPHRAVRNFFSSMRRQPGMTAADRILAVTSFSFDIAALELLLPLTLGASIHIASQQVLADGIALAALLETSGATMLQATPSTWKMLLIAGWAGNPWLKMLCGGEALPLELAEHLRQRGAALWNMYGPTETTIWSAIEDVSAADSEISIGHAIDNTQLYVLDANKSPVPIGAVGELYIGGDGVAHGYWRRPDLTAEQFLPNPFSQQAGARMYRTGDSVRWLENGTLEYRGRIDQQVKLRGYRIELSEIEEVLRDHPAVRDAVVVLRDEIESNKYLAAYVVIQSEKLPTYQELQSHLRKRLPDYMVPATFLYLESLPLTPNGKINRKALPAPEPDQLSQSAEFVAPETELQKQLSEVWAELLHLPRVGIYNNFFELGGHSLLATQLMVRIQTLFQVEIPLRYLFEFPTVAELAQAIERMQNEIMEQADSEELAQILADLEIQSEGEV